MKRIYYLSTIFLAWLLIGISVQSTAQANRVVQPSSTGIQWVIGNSYDIVWTLNPAQCVDIYLSTDGNVAGATKIVNNLGAATTSYSWTPDQAAGDYYIVITHCDGTTLLATSSNTFELVTSTTPSGTIHLIQPSTPGIQWESGTTHLISWDDDVVENLKLELYISNGGSKVPNGEAGLNDAQNLSGTTWEWAIPEDLDNNTYTFKISSTQTGDSDWGVPFVVTDTPSGGSNLTLIQPSIAGIQWESGTTHLISWTDDLIENVKLELYISNGGPIVPNGEAGLNDAQNLSGTTWEWAIPEDLDNNTYTFKISSTQTGVSDWGVPFEVTDTPSGGTTLTLIQPSTAGIQWESGTTHLISWTDDLIENVKLELYISNGGSQVPNVDAGLDGDAQDLSGTTWEWAIPEDLDNNTYTFKISSTQTGVSNWGVPFEVTDTPTGGSNLTLIQPSIAGIQWESGTTHLISWTDDLIENVKLELYISNGGPIVPNGEAGLNDAQNLSGTTWEWAIPEDLDNNTYTFKISSTQTGVSDWGVPFTITDYSPYGEVVVIQPNGGEQWITGNSYLLSWTDNISEDVKIEVTSNASAGAGATWYEIGTGIEGSTWTWNTNSVWPAGLAGTGVDYKIRVSSVSSASGVTDVSNLPFSFVQTVGGNVSINQPNGGEVWLDGTAQLISWDDELVENVYVKLLKGGDDPVADLVPWELTGLPANAYSGAGIEGSTLTWNIPETGGSCYDFDALTVGGYVADQLGGNWETWSDTPGGSDDAEVSDLYSLSGSNSFVVDRVGGSTDLKLEFGGTNLVSGVYSFSNDIYIPAGKTGYWNLQNEVDYSGGWINNYLGFEIKYNASGNMVIGADGSTNALTLPYSNDTWYHNEIVVDLDRDWCDFYIDGEHIIGYQWSLGVHGGTNALAFADFYALTGTDEAYFDNVCFSGGGSGLYAGTNYKIVVESIYDPQYSATSAGDFTIQANPQGGSYITVNQPNGGEVWYQGVSYYISWIDDVIENVNIDLVDANNNFVANIASDVPGSTHVWNINPAIYGVGTYKVHIYSIYNSAVEDYSNAVFTIMPPTRSPNTITGFEGIQASEVMLYPNPTSGQFTVSSPAIINRVEVRNMLGQVLLSNNVEEAHTTIDLAGYEAGIYIVNLIIEGEIVTKKLFVR